MLVLFFIIALYIWLVSLLGVVSLFSLISLETSFKFDGGSKSVNTLHKIIVMIVAAAVHSFDYFLHCLII